MAPLNFEDKIKEKLEQRAIKPSERSWEQLASSLDKEQQKKGTKKIWWYGAAASIVGVLILSSVFFNNRFSEEKNILVVENEIEEPEKQIVKNTDVVEHNDQETRFIDPTEQIIKKDKVNTATEDIVQTVKKRSVIRKQEKKNSIQKVIKPNEVIEVEGENPGSSSMTTAVAENVNKEEEVQKEEFAVSNEIIEDKIANVVAQIQEIQKNNGEVTNNEIDKLLRQAQREITTNNILKSSKVSASALLQDVEEELDDTFKDRVFEALKTGFQKVKTAVAEREN